MPRSRILNGYRAVYAPTHPNQISPCANWKGFVYEHVKVATETLGRKLGADECVHHLDGSRLNNDPENLQVLTQEAHGRLHALKRLGKTEADIAPHPCAECGAPTPHANTYCSLKCITKVRRRRSKFPGKSALLEMLRVFSISKIAEQFGVTDNAVRKWARWSELPVRLEDRKKIRTPRTYRHGIISTYKRGCRCPLCKEKRRTDSVAYRNRLRSRSVRPASDRPS